MNNKINKAKKIFSQNLWILPGILFGVMLAKTSGPDYLSAAPSPAAVQGRGWRPSGDACVAGTRPNIAGLEIFGGKEYKIDPTATIVEGEDATTEGGATGLLGGLAGFRMPGLKQVAGKKQIVALFSIKVGSKSVCLPEASKEVATWGWCSFGGTGEHGVRFSLHQTLRVEYESGMKFPGCPPKCLSLTGFHDCDEKLLQPGVSAVMYPGLAFPVAKWVSNNVEYSRESADRLYKEAVFDQGTIASNQTMDIILGGVVGKAVNGRAICPWDKKQSGCKKYSYSRKMTGSLVRRTYNDLRIGIAPDSAGGLQVRANFSTLPNIETFIVPGNGTNTSAASIADKQSWRRQVQFNKLFDRFCGRVTGDRDAICGQPVMMANASTGGSIIEAADDSLRAMQLCAKMVGDLRARGACDLGQNPLAQQAPDDENTLSAMALDRLTEGARQADTVTNKERIGTGSGNRTVENGQGISMGSQWRRGCQRTFARDSLRTATRGESLAPARERLLECLLAGGEK